MEFYISRFKDIEEKEFEVEVVTPLFLGGADTKKAELRIPSFKGALRFWWRVIYGSDDIEDMKKREDEIFGSTDRKTSFDLKIYSMTDCSPKLSNLPKGKEFKVQSKGKTFHLGILDYLAFGLRDFRTGYTKEHIPDKNKFKLTLVIKNKNAKGEIENAFRMLVYFGGIGAKSRNGFGSLYVPNLQPFQNKNLFNSTSSTKDFTSLSNKCILFNQFSPVNDWTQALSEIGMAYKDARLSIERKHSYEKRLLIAKPIVQARNNDRHSKPYFLHVSKLPNGKYQGQILFMPYNYYEPAKRAEYFKTCEKMNNKLRELSGGAK
ncbi:MAG: type III-B CRISPR module RAMP protein Cmr1 [Desulfobacterales bacterium]|nr:type III-B CRISPR module RAMP protein Cmr1 [Desulfobacterales bacterium]